MDIGLPECVRFICVSRIRFDGFDNNLNDLGRVQDALLPALRSGHVLQDTSSETGVAAGTGASRPKDYMWPETTKPRGCY